jgi:hypothetical protein
MPSHVFTNTTLCGIFCFMKSPDRIFEDRFAWDVHVESHRRMHEGDPRSFRELPLPEQLGRSAVLGCVMLPDMMGQVREELTIFQSELDLVGLAEDR